MDVFFENNVRKCFDFLVREHGFSTPIFYTVAYELHVAYIKNDFFVDIAFDGSYWATVNKSEKVVQGIISGKTKINDLDYRKIASHSLLRLDTKKEVYNSILKFYRNEKALFYYAVLLKNNPEILNGNFRKFSLVYLLLKKIGIK